MNDDLRLHGPLEILDYSIDWSDFFSGTDIISASDWAITPTTSAVINQKSISSDGQAVSCYLGVGLTLGQVYQLTNTITTQSNRTSKRSLTLRCWAE